MTAHLFVYGTLMSSAGTDLGREERERLVREGEIIGPATMSGQLYDLGRYPGLVTPASGDATIVHGELIRLADAEATFRWLDAYENVSAPPQPADEYERAVRAATQADGTTLDAWVYLYRGSLAGARLVAVGRWADRRS